MTVDLTGGLPISREDVLVDRPADPAFREAVNIWLEDDLGRFSFPRIGVEPIGATWDEPAVQANMAFADGRVLLGTGRGQTRTRLDEDGRPTIIGSGPIEFRCVEPFRRWTMSFVGDALATTVADQAAGIAASDRRVEVELQVEMTMVVPPWIQGEMGEEARRLLENGKEGSFMGGKRYEQLFTASGHFRAGDDQYPFDGRGLRIHRQGVRDTTEFRGHCWQSAVFPNGKAFGYIAFPDDDDGTSSYREGYVFDGARMHPAEVVEAPWMTSFEPHGGSVPLVLKSELGEHRIEAVTTCTTAVPGSEQTAKIEAMSGGQPIGRDLFFHQGSARYTWDGEVAHGMIERSLPADLVRR